MSNLLPPFDLMNDDQKSYFAGIVYGHTTPKADVSLCMAALKCTNQSEFYRGIETANSGVGFWRESNGVIHLVKTKK